MTGVQTCALPIYAYVPSNFHVFLRRCGVIFLVFCHINQYKLHADRTSWNGCSAVVHLSRFTLQVVPFSCISILFIKHAYLDKSRSPDQTYIFCSPVFKVLFPFVYYDSCMCKSMFKPMFGVLIFTPMQSTFTLSFTIIERCIDTVLHSCL